MEVNSEDLTRGAVGREARVWIGAIRTQIEFDLCVAQVRKGATG